MIQLSRNLEYRYPREMVFTLLAVEGIFSLRKSLTLYHLFFPLIYPNQWGLFCTLREKEN
jgi:hypothetical protein